MKIKIVEDNETISLYLRLFLEEEGYEVEVEKYPFNRALKGDAWDGVDYAIIDWMLGSSTQGRDILSFLAEKFPTVHCLVLTAKVNARSEVQKVYPNARILLKPSSPEEILGALHDFH